MVVLPWFTGFEVVNDFELGLQVDHLGVFTVLIWRLCGASLSHDLLAK